MVRVGGVHEGAPDLSVERKLPHDSADFALADEAALSSQVALGRAVAGLRKLDLHGFDRIAQLRILALARWP